MRRGTTPTNIFAVDRDLTSARIYISYSQNGQVIVEKTGADLNVTPTQIECVLSQDDTLAFKPGVVEIQIRYVAQDGEADASDIIETTAGRILKEGVITY